MRVLVDYRQDGSRVVWDEDARVVTDYDPSGAAVATRPYNAEETQRIDSVDRHAAVAQARLVLDRAIFLTAATELNDFLVATLAVDREVDGGHWREPRDVAHSYPLGWHVQYRQQTWESTEPANIWKPGVQGWVAI
jgi:hypothetical protein